MKKIRFLSMLMIAMMLISLTSCAHYGQIDPSIFNQTLAEANQFLESGDLKRACQKLKRLQKSPQYSLGKIVKWKLLFHCSPEQAILSEELKSEPSAYLKEYFYQQSYELSKRSNWTDLWFKSIIKLLPLKKNYFDKIKLLREAQKLALAHSDESQLKTVQDLLYSISPSSHPNPPVEDLLKVAADYEKRRNFHQARLIYQKIIDETLDEKSRFQALSAMAQTYKVERKLDVYVNQTTKHTEYYKKYLESLASKSVEQLQQVKFFYAQTTIQNIRAIWTDHRTQEALKLVLEAIQNISLEPEQLATLYWIKSSIYLELNQTQDAIIALLQAAQPQIFNQIKDEKLKENIAWSTLWLFYKEGKEDQYDHYFKQFEISLKKNQSFNLKAKFWLAQLKFKNGETDEALQLWSQIAGEDEFNYYGILSRHQMGKSFSPVESKTPSDELSVPEELKDLFAANEKNLLQKYMAFYDENFKTINQRMEAFKLYKKYNYYQGALRQIFYIPVDKRNSLSTEFLDTLYPSPFATEVQAASKMFNIEASLIYSIMRQESRYIETERSWADAFGLMQITPEKASDLSKTYQIPFHSFEDLYRPSTNILMGAALLAELKQQSKGHFPIMIASYNASPEAINRWIKERFKGDYLEFIEEIPYEETRNYIKLVFRNLINYKRLEAQEEFFLQKNPFDRLFTKLE